MTLRSLLRSPLVLCLAALSDVLTSAEVPPCESLKLCPEDVSPTTWCMTSQFWFEAESAWGASGDVVGVTITLHYAPEFDFEFTSIDLNVCHDPAVAELVGEPVYSEEILERNPLSMSFVAVREDQNPRHTGSGFTSHFGALRDKSPVSGGL